MFGPSFYQHITHTKTKHKAKTYARAHKKAAYRKLSGDRIETDVDGVLEIGRIRNVRFGVTVRWLRALDFAFQRLLLAIGIFGFCVWIR